MKYTLALVAVLACTPQGSHWERRCVQTQERRVMTLVHIGKVTVPMTRMQTVCIAYDSIWIVVLPEREP